MQIKDRHIIILSCALILLAGGCRSHREVAKTDPRKPAVTESVEQQTPSSEPKPQCYTANFKCSAQGIQASGQLRMMTDSIIWASAAKIIELGRAELTPDSVLIYVKMLNRSYRGSYDDIYRRFHYRTSFEQIQTMVMAPDADKQIAALMKQLRIEGTIRLDPLKEVETLTFPFNIPANSRPL